MITEYYYRKLVGFFDLSSDPQTGESVIDEKVKFYPNIKGIGRFVQRADGFFQEDVEVTGKLSDGFTKIAERMKSEPDPRKVEFFLENLMKIKVHSDDMRDLLSFFMCLVDLFNGKTIDPVWRDQILRFLEDIGYKTQT